LLYFIYEISDRVKHVLWAQTSPVLFMSDINNTFFVFSLVSLIEINGVFLNNLLIIINNPCYPKL
jgi:hypothetical protein